MLTYGFTQEMIERAAQRANVRLVDFRPAGHDRAGRPKFRFRLGLVGERWRRLNHRGDRKVAAVCWHGHKAFFDLLFEQGRDGRVVTAHADYDGYARYKRDFGATGDTNIGSIMQPTLYRYACECR